MVAADPSDPLLPDLVADPPTNPVITPYTYQNGTQALLLRFDGFVNNRGRGALEVRGSNRVGDEYTTVRQWVDTVGGTPRELTPTGSPPVMRFEPQDSHNHWHLREAARYSLWNAERTTEVTPAMKTGFCLVDYERVTSTAPARFTVAGTNFCGQGEPTRATLTEGISPGFRDVYNRNLAYQWVDISSVTPGRYRIAAQVDTTGVIAESDETNNGYTFSANDSVVPGYVASPVTPAPIPAGRATTITLAATTFGAPGARRFRIQTLPTHGTLTVGTTTLTAGALVDGGSVTYTPNAGYAGGDVFTYSALDATSPFPRTPTAAAVTLTVEAGVPAPAVTLSGVPGTLRTGAQAALAAVVTGTTGGVTWTVNGIAGGNATVGTITSAGVYTAPAAVPSPASVTVRATSTASPAAFDEATITIAAMPAAGPNLVVNPSFELDTAGWSGWRGTISRVPDATAPDGGFALRTDMASGTSYLSGPTDYVVRDAAAATTYRASVWVKAATPSAVGKSVTLRVLEMTPSGGERARWNSVPVVLTTAYQQLSVEALTQVAGDHLDTYVVQSGAATGDAFMLDDYRLWAATDGPPPPVNQPPVADFSMSTAAPNPGESVTLIDGSTDPDGAVVARAWDLDNDGAFDDGSDTTATVSFATAGDHVVRLRVTDNAGATHVTQRTIAVVAPVVTVAVSGAPQTLTAGAAATLTATVAGAAAGVTWSVDGVAGGNATVGTITASGLYTAPTAVPPAGRVTIRATSTATPTAYGEAVIAIQAAGDPDPAPGGGTNLVANPSIETDTTGWETWRGRLSRVLTGDAPHGVAALRTDWVSSSSYVAGPSGYVARNVTAGATYVATVYVKAATASSVGKPVVLRLVEYTPAGAERAKWSSAPVTLATSFQKVTVTGTMTTAGDHLDTWVVQTAAGAGNAFLLDAYSVMANPAAPPPPPPANQLPQPSFTVAPASPVAGQTVAFTDTSTDPDGTVANREWDLDNDGAFDDATGVQAQTVFPTAGSFTVRVRVTDNVGGQAIAGRAVTVTAPPPDGSVNLVANGGFETDLSGWTTWQGALSRVAVADAPQGGFVARVERRSGTSFTIDDAPAVVTSSQTGTYTAVAQVQAATPSAVGKRVTLYLRERNPTTGVTKTIASTTVTLTTRFQPVTATAAIATPGTAIEVFAGQSGAVAGDAFHIDAIALTRRP